MVAVLSGEALERFLQEIWGRRADPVARTVIRPLGWERLRALAMAEEVESRLVLESIGDYPWQSLSGPFSAEMLDSLPPAGWTLLLHSMERHEARCAELLTHFPFVPRWCFDDVMVSYAPPGGSVGPHIDRYHAFLVQAAGRREWIIEDVFRSAGGALLLEGCDLEILAGIRPDRLLEVDPGTVLYVPPGIAHHGLALDTVETWSVGIAVPELGEIAEDFIDHVLSEVREREEDPTRAVVSASSGALPAPAKLSPVHQEAFALCLGEVFTSDRIHRWSRRRLGEWLSESPRAASSEGRFHSANEAAGLERLDPAVRCLYSDEPDGSVMVYAEGDSWAIHGRGVPLARALCNLRPVSSSEIHAAGDPGLESLTSHLRGRGWLLGATENTGKTSR